MIKPKRKQSLLWQLGGALLLTCGMIHAQSSDNVAPAHTTLDAADGQAVFQRICQGCHMPDAKGAAGAGTYPALVDNPRLISAPYMAAVILHGRHNMPSFMKDSEIDPLGSAKLSDVQIAAVINYIRTHFGNHYSDTITAKDVSAMHF